MSGYNRWDPLGSPATYSGPPLRSWQQQALTAWEEHDRKGVIEAITGTGKSLVGVAAIHEVIAIGGCALVIVPTRALVAQWASTLRGCLPGVKIGQLSDGEKSDFSNSDVVVATVQSVYANPIRPRSLMLLVADEVHRYGSEQFKKALRKEYAWRLGLSGTYERQQDDGVARYLNPYFGDVRFKYGYEEALRDETVAEFELAFVETPLSKHELAEYEEADEKCKEARKVLLREFNFPSDFRDFFAMVSAGAGMNEPGYLQDTCRQYMSGFADRKKVLASASSKLTFVEAAAKFLDRLGGTIIFSETKASAAQLAFVANKAVSALPIDGESKAHEREKVLRDFANGRLRVISAPRILDEGIDVPDAEVAIIASASQTKRQMVQRMGRVIRLKPDGRSARIVILFAPGTPEDPNTGGYEAFIDEVRPFARSERQFSAKNLSDFSDWLASASL